MTWISTNAVSLLLLLAIVALGSWGAYTQHRVDGLQQDNQELLRQRDEAQLILGNQQRTLSLFNAIAEATHEEKRQNTQQMEVARAVVRRALEPIPAAAVRVPDAVADRVRAAVAEIRGAAGGERQP